VIDARSRSLEGKIEANVFIRPGQPKKKFFVPPDQVQLDELVHILREHPQGDGQLVLGATAFKIGFPQLAGIDFAFLPDQILKGAMSHEQL